MNGRALAHVLTFFAGIAALSWEVVWQLQSSLAIGVSAKGTAITLAATMAGFALGSTLAGRVLSRYPNVPPFKAYAALELVIGLSGVALLLPGFRALAGVDAAIFARAPALASFVHVTSILVLLAPATASMGATVPVLGMMGRLTGTSIATLYAANTAGACTGVLVVSFLAIPYLGIEVTTYAMAFVNLTVAATALLARVKASDATPSEDRTAPAPSEAEAELAPEPKTYPTAGSPSTQRPASGTAWLVVLVTGFVSFGLEVAWFRALRAAFLSTTQTFAIILAAVLAPLAFGASMGAYLARKKMTVGAALVGAGVAILAATPLLMRFDRVAAVVDAGFWATTLAWLAASLLVMGPAMLLLGAALPWVLRERAHPRDWSRLYAVNTAGAVVGSLAAAWILLPLVGSTRSSWFFGVVTLVAGVCFVSKPRRWVAAASGVFALVVAVGFDIRHARDRVIGNFNSPIRTVLAFEEGPNTTLAVVDDADNNRLLVIDGLVATSQAGAAHYMEWMGRLPMLLHPNPENALVICFGTGQTANAVRREGPASLDIVELDAAVFKMAPLFDRNEGVLRDERVHPIVMDGRAWLRRTTRKYDVITLEPMPPNFAGVNSLYSREFYAAAAERMTPSGVIAQWVPFHILSVHDGVAIATTFQHVFNDSLLWLDPPSRTAILVGRRGPPSTDFAKRWPGFERVKVARSLSAADVKKWVALDPIALKEYAKLGEIITDDNQLLAYGPHRNRDYAVGNDLENDNLALVARVAAETAKATKAKYE